MIFRVNASSGVPLYVQLIEQIKHAVETGLLREGEQLPGIRKLAEDLVINPNTVAKVYRELEHEGVIELRQGAGAFVSAQRQGAVQAKLRRAQPLVRHLVGRLEAMGIEEEEMRRLFEAELAARVPEAKK